MSAVLIGEGEAEFQGKTMNGAKALQMAGLHAVTLGPKEGLATYQWDTVFNRLCFGCFV